MATTEQLKDKASDVLLSMIDVTVKSMSDVIEFGKQQIPEVIHQLLLWQLTSSLLWIAVGIVLTILGALWCRKANQWVKQDSENVPAHIATIVLFALGAWAIISNSLDALQIWVAPKVYLIQYAASLARGGN